MSSQADVDALAQEAGVSKTLAAFLVRTVREARARAAKRFVVA